MNKQELQNFLGKLASGEYTNEEYAAFVKWVENSSREDYQQMLDYWEDLVGSGEMFEAVSPQLIENIERGLDNIDQRKFKIRRLWPRIAAAASILLIISAGGYFITHKKQPIQQITLLKPGTYKNDVLPGNKAFITLANGKQVAVTTSPQGQLAVQGSTSIQKSANGDVVYHASGTNTEVAYNTFTVPRGGGKHEIQLADGSLAVLDASSSIRFPVAFNGKDRRVSITGQVYFEVIHNEKQPFYVTANNQMIEDIGTHFNINAFDGDTKTTLIEGSVKVNNVLLKPGQQAISKPDGSVNVLNEVDEEVVMAWKNDLFKFSKNTSLQTVMNQLGRWYDMDVVYEGSNKIYHFGGDMPRYSKLSDVLKILAYNGVQFSVDGKKIIVYQ